MGSLGAGDLTMTRGFVAACFLILAAACSSTATPEAAPSPTTTPAAPAVDVSGPAQSEGQATAAAQDLASSGYAESEYFFGGTATTYEGEHHSIGVTFVGRNQSDFVMTDAAASAGVPLYRWKILRFASPRPFVPRELAKLSVASAERRIYSAVGVLEDGTLAVTGDIKLNRVVGVLEDVAPTRPEAAWTVAVAALPVLLKATTPPAATADLLQFAAKLAAAGGRRATVDGLAQVAARTGSSRLVTEARRVARVLEGGSLG